MDVITLSQNLYEAYVVILLGAGAALGLSIGIAVGRLVRRRSSDPSPTPSEPLQHRVSLLEQELEQTTADVQRLLRDREFMRELRRPRSGVAAA